MTNTYHNNIQNQDGSPDFSMDLSLAIRGIYAAANTAPGPAFKKLLTRAAADLEAAKRTYGLQRKLKATTDRMTRNAESPAHV